MELSSNCEILKFSYLSSRPITVIKKCYIESVFSITILSSYVKRKLCLISYNATLFWRYELQLATTFYKSK